MRRPRLHTVPPRLQQRSAPSSPRSRSGRRSPPRPVARPSRPSVVSWPNSSRSLEVRRRCRMKTAETPVPPRSTPGHPPEAPLRHAALVVGRGHSKMLTRHCAKLAVVYVRQSSLQQMMANGASTQERHGFQRLLAAVTMHHVGLVLGLEMSRLARSSTDWHHVLEVCALFGTLLADQDGVYDASDPNDRLLLGLKGTLSAVELHTMRQRLERG